VVPPDPQKYHRYLQRLKAGYGLSYSEQLEWTKLARYWLSLYQEAGNQRMYEQVQRALKTYANGRKPARKRTTIEEDFSAIANEVLR